MENVNRNFGDAFGAIHIRELDESPTGSLVTTTERKYIATKSDAAYVRYGGKRLLDILVAAGSLLFFLPVVLLISVALVFADGLPISFRHKRIGLGGNRFGCLKFRSMVKDSEHQLHLLLKSDAAARLEWDTTHKLKNDPRIHSVGSFLRKSSLDELPQLLNVLRGEMSIVGPRPIVDAEIYRYGEHFSSLTSTRPGLTGLWQVSGRSDVSYNERVALDVQYAQTVSLWLDIRIILKTVWVVFHGRGSF